MKPSGIRWGLVVFGLVLAACSSNPPINATGTWLDLTAKTRPLNKADCPEDPINTGELRFSLNQSGSNVSGTVRAYTPGQPAAYGDVTAQIRQDGTINGNMVFSSQSGNSVISIAFEGRIQGSYFIGKTISPLTSQCPSNQNMVSVYLEWNAQKQ